MELFSIFIYYQSYLINTNIEFIEFEIYQFYILTHEMHNYIKIAIYKISIF